MAERRENSVLFSLSELRRVEEERIKQEEAEAQARIEAAERARLDAERRVRDEEERKQREAQEFAMRERLERERLDRDHRVRIEEAGLRVKAEADARLREQQMHLEMQLKAKHPPIKAIVTIVGALFLVVCALGYYMYSQHEAEKRAQDAIIARQQEDARKLQAQLEEQQREALAIKRDLGQL